MPFWRRRRDEEQAVPTAEAAPESIVDPDAVEPGWEPDPADFEDAAPAPDIADEPVERRDAAPVPEPAAEPEPEPAPALPAGTPEGASEATAFAAPQAAPPAYAAFDPTAFLAVAPAHTLDEGLQKTRGGFVTQLPRVHRPARAWADHQ